MSNLMQIETNVLSSPEVKLGLKINEIRRVQRSIGNAQKSKFSLTLDMSKLVVESHEWFTSDEGKRKFAEEGLTWTNEEFGFKVFGWQKSYFYKVLKAGKLEPTVVDKFNELCDDAEREGKDPKRTLEGLLKFSRSYSFEDSEDSEGSEGSEDTEDTEDTEDSASIELRVPTILTLSFKASEIDMGRNVSVRVDSTGKATTSNTIEEISLAIQYLTQTLTQREL